MFFAIPIQHFHRAVAVSVQLGWIYTSSPEMTKELPNQPRLQGTVQLPKVIFDQYTGIKIISFYLHYAISRNAVCVYPSK